MIKVFQAEWCPHCHKIRQRLTELEVPFIAIPVQPNREEREELIKATGQNTIPAIVFEDGTTLTGKDEDILKGLNDRFPENKNTEEHKRHNQDFDAQR